MKWAEVIARPEFGKLSAAQQEATREAYFQEVVAPQFERDQLPAIREEFDRDTRIAKQDLPADVRGSNIQGGRGMVIPPVVEPSQQRRGGVRGEVRPFVGGDAREEDPPRPDASVLDRPFNTDVPFADASRQLRATTDAAAAQRRTGVARPMSRAQSFEFDVNEALPDSAVVRGAAAGAANLGRIGIGAARLAADLTGADGVAKAMEGASAMAGATERGAMSGLQGNDKLVADVTSSIINSAPSVAVGMFGGPAMRTLFAQSTLAEYNAGRDAGFDPGESLARAGIMGTAEALGERFGFSEQIRLIKTAAKQLPANDLAKVLGSMIVKEVPGEQLTTAMQFLADKVGPAALNPGASFADYLAAAGETLKVTIGQTAVMGGGPAAIATARKTYGDVNRNQAAPEQRAAGAIDQGANAFAAFFKPAPDAVAPTAVRADTLRRFDEAAAAFGLNPKAAAKVREQAGQLLPDEAPGFLARVMQSLAARNLFRRPVDEQSLLDLDGRLRPQPKAPKKPQAPDAPRGTDGAATRQFTMRGDDGRDYRAVFDANGKATWVPVDAEAPAPTSAIAAADLIEPEQPNGQPDLAATPGLPARAPDGGGDPAARGGMAVGPVPDDANRVGGSAAGPGVGRGAAEPLADGGVTDPALSIPPSKRTPEQAMAAMERASAQDYTDSRARENAPDFEPREASDILSPKGAAWASKAPAAKRLKELGDGFRVARVSTGWVVKPVAASSDQEPVKQPNPLSGNEVSSPAAVENNAVAGGDQAPEPSADTTAAPVTMPEIAALQDVPTVEVMREAQDAVGPDEFKRLAEAKIAEVKKGKFTEPPDSMLIEATAREIVAKSRRATAAQPQPESAPQAAEPAPPAPTDAAAPAKNAAAGEEPAAAPVAAAPPKVYKLRSQAEKARAGNTQRLRKVKGGYILREATDKELAAADRAGRRLAGGTGVDVDRDPLLTAIAKLGGLSIKERSDTIGEGNRNIGGKMLFRISGKSIDDIANNALQEFGYIPAEHRSDPVRWLRDAIKAEFMGTQQHFSEQGTGWLEDATGQAVMTAEEIEAAQQAYDEAEAQRLADWTLDDLESSGYTALSPEEQALTEQLLAEAESLGIDTEAMRERVAQQTENEAASAYNAQLQAAARQAVAQAREDARSRDAAAAREGDEGRGEPAGEASQEGLTLEAQDTESLREKTAREAAAAEADKREQKRLADKAAADAQRDEFVLTGSDRPADVAVAAGQGGLFDAPATPEPQQTDRFEAGRALTKEQRKQVLGTLVDVYKAKGAPREMKGQSRDGNERYGYVHSPELFEKSDITGAMVRYYVTLPDGRRAHPSELFPEYTQSDIEAEMQRRESAERADADEQRRAEERADRVAADTPQAAEAAFRERNKGPWETDWRTGKKRSLVTLEKGGKFYALTDDDTALMARLERAGWAKVAAPSPQAKEAEQGEAPAKPRAQAGKAAAKIEDFGEKLEGARKDFATKMKDAMALDVKAVPLSESWPEPNYAKLLEGGADPFIVGWVHASRDEIPTKPQQPWKLQQWVKSVTLLRDVSQKLLTGEITKDKLLAQMPPSLRDAVAARGEMYERLGHEQSLKGIRVSVGQYSMLNGIPYNPAKVIWSVERSAKGGMFGNWPRQLAIGDTREQAIDAFVVKVMADSAALEKAGRATTFDIWRENGKFHVGKKIGRQYASFKRFDSVKEARDYKANNQAELEAALERYKTVPFERKTENAPRVGADHRGGARVTPEVFADTFGFRGVQFGNYVEDNKRQADLNDAYDALMDLAAVLGIPPRALSLNGQLGLAFGARGKGGKNAAAAHYEPGSTVINLTKESGAGSLAHEWFHAADNYFGKMGGAPASNFMTAGTGNPAVRAEMAAAFRKVNDAIRSTGMRARAKALDERRTKEYWSTPVEMAARAFEAYAIAKLRDNNAANDYLANVVSPEFWQAQEALSGREDGNTYPYPLESEMGPISEAFDGFFRTVETRTDEAGNVALYDLASGHTSDPADKTKAAERFDRLTRKLRAGEVTEGYVRVAVSVLAREIDQHGVARGPAEVRQDIRAARAAGTMAPETADFALWALEQNPALATNLGLKVEPSSQPGVFGDYNPATEIIRVFDGNADSATAVHEIMHHAERMMPAEMQAAIRREWAAALANAIKTGTPEQAKALQLIAGSMTGSRNAHMDLVGAILDGPLNYEQHYQLVNPSEFWAVNASRLLAQRYAAKDSVWAKVHTWLKEMVQKLKGLLGQRSDAPVLKALEDLLKSDGSRKSSTILANKDALAAAGKVLQNIGRTNPDKASAKERAEPGWTMPDGSRFDDYVYKFQDKNIDLKRAVRSIRKDRLEIEDRWDAYLQEELFHGRAATRTQDFVDDELKPALAEMAQRKVSLEELDQYLHARHAEEANKLIAERNKREDEGQMDLDGKPITSPLQDGGSGMLTADARKYLAGLPAAKRQDLEAIAAKVDKIIAGTRDLYVAYGLESKSVVDGWAKMFEHYVPLMREDHDGGMGIGQGFSIKGRESKQRTGSTAKVVDILANIALQREKAIVRGEKNRVAVALAGLAKLNPNPDVWTFDKVPTERVFNDKTGKVEERQDPLFKTRPNVLIAKILDKDGQVHERAVAFNTENERAMRMATALKNLDAAQLEGLLAVSAKITRYFAAINTQWNPIFGVVNLARDVQGAAINLSSTPIADKRMEVVKNIPAALRAIYRDERGKQAKNEEMARLWDEMQSEGGMTGFRDLYRNSEDRADAIRFAIDPTAWMDGTVGRFVTASGLLKAPVAVAQKGATKVFDWLTDYNQSMEGAVRLAAYKVALEQGLSKQRAASVAKNLTVNFNRKGQVGQQVGALYAFFNASVQGTARMGEVLLHNPDGKGMRLTRMGAKIVAGGILLGSMQALLLAAAGFDEDEPPGFVRERALIIPTGWATGKKDYITIPMPLGWHVLPNIGRVATEYALSGGKNAAKRITGLVGLLAEAFNPVGSAGMSLQTLSPTALDPLVALAENRDWTGRPIAREGFNKAEPGHLRAKDTASTVGKYTAEAINWMSGGTKYQAGMFSPTPDQIDYLLGQVTGGIGREVSKAEQSVRAMFTGEDLAPHKVPLVGRFYGNAEAGASQASRFYENLLLLDKHEAELKGRAAESNAPKNASGENLRVKAYEQEHPEATLWRYGNKASEVVRKLRKQKREQLAAGAPRKDIKETERQITEQMLQLNEQVRKAVEGDKKKVSYPALAPA